MSHKSLGTPSTKLEQVKISREDQEYRPTKLDADRTREPRSRRGTAKRQDAHGQNTDGRPSSTVDCRQLSGYIELGNNRHSLRHETKTTKALVVYDRGDPDAAKNELVASCEYERFSPVLTNGSGQKHSFY